MRRVERCLALVACLGAGCAAEIRRTETAGLPRETQPDRDRGSGREPLPPFDATDPIEDPGVAGIGPPLRHWNEPTWLGKPGKDVPGASIVGGLAILRDASGVVRGAASLAPAPARSRAGMRLEVALPAGTYEVDLLPERRPCNALPAVLPVREAPPVGRVVVGAQQIGRLAASVPWTEADGLESLAFRPVVVLDRQRRVVACGAFALDEGEPEPVEP